MILKDYLEGLSIKQLIVELRTTFSKAVGEMLWQYGRIEYILKEIEKRDELI